MTGHTGAPELLTSTQVAALLGVSRQRVHQLATGHPEFPVPVYELANGKLWSRAAVEAFDAGWERRRTGRPRKVQA